MIIIVASAATLATTLTTCVARSARTCAGRTSRTLRLNGRKGRQLNVVAENAVTTVTKTVAARSAVYRTGYVASENVNIAAVIINIIMSHGDFLS